MTATTGPDGSGQARGTREISTIAFPYTDLDEAVKLARTMHAVGGGVPMERDQVSAALNSAGGSLANKLSAAKQFGLIDSQQARWSLTTLGYGVLDSATERAAKAEAFLNVELYKRTFDEYRGRTLPGRAGLEHAFTTFGVATKQKEKARQTFERSARSAGFFPSGSEDRLVAPILGPQNAAEPVGSIAVLADQDVTSTPSGGASHRPESICRGTALRASSS
jgi:hypothetical protein